MELSNSQLVVCGVVGFGVVVRTCAEKDRGLTVEAAVFDGKMLYVLLLEGISFSACCVQSQRAKQGSLPMFGFFWDYSYMICF